MECLRKYQLHLEYATTHCMNHCIYSDIEKILTRPGLPGSQKGGAHKGLSTPHLRLVSSFTHKYYTVGHDSRQRTGKVATYLFC